jgi:hypothetical protein
MRKIVLTFGLIAGAILSAMMLLALAFKDAIGFDKGLIVGYTSMVLAFMLVYFGVRSYRDNVAGGSVSFGRALAVGALIVVVASVCYVATWELIYYVIAPDFMEKFQAYMIEQARASGATPAQVQAKIAEAQHFVQLYRNPLFNIAVTFVEPLPVGLVLTLVSAGILSRKRRREEPGLAAAVA